MIAKRIRTSVESSLWYMGWGWGGYTKGCEREFFWNSMVFQNSGKSNDDLFISLLHLLLLLFFCSRDRIILYLETEQRRWNILMGLAVNEWNRIGWLLAICANDHLLCIITSIYLFWLMVVIFEYYKKNWVSSFYKIISGKCEISF